MTDRWWKNSSGKPRGSVMTVLGTVVLASGGGFWTLYLNPGRDRVTAADKISQCETRHHLSNQMVINRRAIKNAAAVSVNNPTSRDGKLATFQLCSWPPADGQDADGYASISVTSVDGPGRDEVSQQNVADRVDSPCSTTHLIYDHAAQGATSQERLAVIGGRFWMLFNTTGSPEVANPAPGRINSPPVDEAIVLHNSSDDVSSVAC